MWHYVQNGQSIGPVETFALQGLLENGSLSPDALVWRAGMTEWVAIHSVPEFAHVTPGAVPPPIPPPVSMPPRVAPTTEPPDPSDVAHNKVFAVLAYIPPLFLVPLLGAPQSRFARYHTNQGIVLFLAALVIGCGSHVLLPFPVVHLLLVPIWGLLPAAVCVFVIIGIVHAASGQCKPLPLIGHYQLLN